MKFLPDISVSLAVVLLTVLIVRTAIERGERAAREIRVQFDDADAGRVPDGWRVEATRREDGPLAIWLATPDSSAPSQPNVLALRATQHGKDQTFNLCWNDALRFHNGRIGVRFKAVEGKVDQGGGPIWRVRDADNYYICRANPLESNFRVYKVVGGARKQLASAKVDVDAGEWHTIEVDHHGDRIVCVLDGKFRLKAIDNELPEEGGVGVWTKADALTHFDDLTVLPAAR